MTWLSSSLVNKITREIKRTYLYNFVIMKFALSFGASTQCGVFWGNPSLQSVSIEGFLLVIYLGPL